MDSMLGYIVAIYTLYVILKIYVSVMQVGFVAKEKHKDAVLLHPKAYIEAAEYEISKGRISIIGDLIDYVLFFFWIAGGFAYLDGLLQDFDGILKAVAFVDSFIVLNWLVHLPISLYSKFSLDKKYGFNKTTPKLYMQDLLKEAALFFIFGSAIIGVLSYFIESFQNWWLISFGFVFVVIVLINMIYPTIIAPMFNKFEALKDEELNQKIETLLQKSGFKSSGVFTIDSSKRDTRLNAYFGGLGSTKRVVLFDTLLEKLTHNELLAVLGHELGHFKHGDIYKNIALMGVMMFGFFFILGNLPDQIFNEMGVYKESGTLISFFFIITTPLGFLISPIINYFSRAHEFAADEYGAMDNKANDLKKALIKLSTENKSFPKAHKLYEIFYHTHPLVLERIEKMGGMPQEA